MILRMFEPLRFYCVWLDFENTSAERSIGSLIIWLQYLVCKFRKIVGKTDLSEQLKDVNRYRKMTDYKMDILLLTNRINVVNEPLRDRTKKNCMCAQLRLRSAWASSAQSDQSLRYALNG